MIGRRAFVALLFLCPAVGRGADAEPARRWREPSALAYSADGRFVYVANRATGSISVVDVGQGAVVAEQELGKAPADLVALPGGGLLAVDEADGRLLRLSADGPKLAVVDRLAVAPGPLAVVVEADGRRAYVASGIARRLTIVDLAADGSRLKEAAVVRLPFEPRSVVATEAGRAIVADGLGGGLAVVDASRGEVESARTLPAHNIRGLAIDREGRLLIAQQRTNPEAHTDVNDIHWGELLANDLRVLPLGDVLEPKADVLRDGRLVPLGEPGRGAADPEALLVLPDGRVAVAFGGVDEVALGPVGSPIVRRVAVGHRPVALALAPDGAQLAVADELDDTVVLIDLTSSDRPVTIGLGPTPEPDRVRAGRLLFHDARLSLEGWMSCRSCHADGRAIGVRADTLGDGTYGTPKVAPSLRGVGQTGPWAWDGHVKELEDQVRASVATTMRGPKPTDDQVAALTAYLRSFEPPPPGDGDDPSIARGAAVFRARRCERCHEPPTYTTPRTYEVGLADEAGQARFNPPSLRGLGRRTSFFHDGRASSAREVLDRFRHQLETPLGEDELDDLLAFLRSL